MFSTIWTKTRKQARNDLLPALSRGEEVIFAPTIISITVRRVRSEYMKLRKTLSVRLRWMRKVYSFCKKGFDRYSVSTPIGFSGCFASRKSSIGFDLVFLVVLDFRKWKYSCGANPARPDVIGTLRRFTMFNCAQGRI